MKQQPMIIMTLEEYESMTKELERLRLLKDAEKPSIEEVLCPDRLYALLKHNGIENVADITLRTRKEWECTRGFGDKTMKDLDNLVFQFGLRYKE